MIEELVEKGPAEDEIVEILMELSACGELEAKFTFDLELGKDVGCLVVTEEEPEP